MKIKIKGNEKVKDISPNEWAKIEKLGTANEYEVIERNTVWGVPLNAEGNVLRGKQEFEKEHWDNLMALGSKSRWKRAENDVLKVSEKESTTENIEPDKLTLEPLKIADLQIELTQSQINETNAKTELTVEQTKDLKRKWIYFFIGAILGNVKYIIEWIQSICPAQ